MSDSVSNSLIGMMNAVSLSVLMNPLSPRQKNPVPSTSSGTGNCRVLITELPSTLSAIITPPLPDTSCVSIPFLTWNQDMAGMGMELAAQLNVRSAPDVGSIVD